MKRAELAMAGFLLVVSVAYGVEGFRYPYTGRVGPGAGFLPIWASLFGVVTAFLLLGRAWRLGDLSVSTASLSSGRSAWLGVLPVALALIGWAVLARVLGGIAAIGVFVFAVTWWLAGREDRTATQRVVLAVATTAVVTLAIFLIFQAWLGVRLPAGIVGDGS